LVAFVIIFCSEILLQLQVGGTGAGAGASSLLHDKKKNPNNINNIFFIVLIFLN